MRLWGTFFRTIPNRQRRILRSLVVPFVNAEPGHWRRIGGRVDVLPARTGATGKNEQHAENRAAHAIRPRRRDPQAGAWFDTRHKSSVRLDKVRLDVQPGHCIRHR